MGEAECLSGTGLQIHLKYYLTEKTDSGGYGKLYGIRIEKWAPKEDGETQGEEGRSIFEAEETPAITFDRDMAEGLLTRLRKGAVTPMGLIPCVDDAVTAILGPGHTQGTF